MCGMAFLPQELSGTEEGTGRLLPADNGAPLVVNLRKITIRMNVIFIEITEQGLRGWAHAETLLEIFQSALCHPGYLGSKAFHMILLLLKQALGNEHRKINVLHASLFETAVQLIADVLPDGITSRFDDHAAFYAGVIDQFCFSYHIRIPLGEIFFHGCDRFYKFLVLCHVFSPFLFFK